MTPSIHILPPEVASQIAAGEVVERPAAVVKELVENALDAQARNITIEVEQGGRRRIRVSDDGDGIPAGEVELALARHATSKLAAIGDLDAIRTLGFRGEALASIAAVSRVTLTSKHRADAQGVRVRIEGGKTTARPAPASGPQGTAVDVEDLFYNVPARLKFLKSETTERRAIDSLVGRYALAYPAVRFRLLVDGRESLQTTGGGDRREALAAVFGVEIAQRMLVLTGHAGPGRCAVSGFISPIDISRSNRKDIYLFLNGRPITDAGLSTAVVQSYHTMLMVGRFPLAAVFIEMAPGEVDVNVHPSKSEVRFQDPDVVFSAVQRAVRQSLISQSPVPEVRPPETWPQPAWTAGGGNIPEPGWRLDHAPEEVESGGWNSMGAGVLPPAGGIPLLRVLGQIGASYLVAEGPDGLYLIDQHAAHERVLFEAMRKSHGETAAQALLTPEIVELPPAQARLVEGQIELLRGIGLAVESFGGSAFRVSAMPQILSRLAPADALRAIVEDIEEDETPLAAETEARLIARICKRAAVKAGRILTPEEQSALVSALERCESPRSCPHGRPTMIHLSVGLLERQFGRKG